MSREFYKLIEKYFLGLLSEAEKNRFKDLMDNDPEFKKEFEEYELTMKVIQVEGKKHLKQRFSAINNKKSEKNPRLFYLSFIVGIVGILATATYFIFIKENKVSQYKEDNVHKNESMANQKTDSTYLPEKQEDQTTLNTLPQKPVNENQNYDSLFAARYKPYRHGSLEPTYRGDNNVSNRDQFLRLYWQEKYLEALLQYNAMTAAEKLNPNIKFQYAICLIENRQYALAETILEALKKEDKSRFGKEIEWYLSLLKLKRGVTIKNSN